MTPRKPWSFFLNFFWSKIWTARTLSSLTRLECISIEVSRVLEGVEGDVHVEALVPVRVQRLLDDARGARLLAIDRGHGEGVREACIAW